MGILSARQEISKQMTRHCVIRDSLEKRKSTFINNINLVCKLSVTNFIMNVYFLIAFNRVSCIANKTSYKSVIQDFLWFSIQRCNVGQTVM